MIKTTSFRIFLLAIIFIAACKSQQKQPFGRDTNLENKRWVLRELNNKTISHKEDEKESFILFDNKDNTFGGSGNCNSINGMYTVQEEMINIHSMASTEMACPSLNIETEFFQTLSKVNRYELKKKREGNTDKESLILFIDKVTVAKFDAGNK